MSDAAAEIRGYATRVTAATLKGISPYGPTVTLHFAEGMLDAICAHIAHTHGPQCAFETLTRCADGVGKEFLGG